MRVRESNETIKATVTEGASQAAMIVTEKNANAVLIINGDSEVVGFDITTAPPTGEPYTGTYDITPLPYAAQELQTANKTLARNVIVAEIPYYETHNDHGLTVYIGE